MNVLRRHSPLVALLAGLIAVAGFAPWYIFPLPMLSLALVFWLWVNEPQARRAALIGFMFGLGLFGGGFGWVYIALNEFGGMPMPVAFVVTMLFVAFFALFPSAVAYVQAKLQVSSVVRLALLLPALWVGAELFRGYLFTGFPWLSVGYSQVPDSPLLGFAAVLGIYGVSLFLVMSAGLLVFGVQHRQHTQGKAAFIAFALIWLLGAGLRMVEWTVPIGEPFKVSLLQGNIDQANKFEEGRLIDTLETYRRLVESSDARLIVLPETALPLLRSEVPERYLELLREQGKRIGADVLVGAFEEDAGAYYNAMFSLGISPTQTYRKNHLVPFGEFIPLRSALDWLVSGVLHIPMSDLSRGGAHQPVMKLSEQRVAMNICFEDVFGEEIIRALPEATLLVNTSNDAWYGHSNAAIQHNQISQMRAVESGRMMLRATNTGMTSVIGVDGKVQQMLPQHMEAVLTATAQGYAGATPYVRWGNAAVMLLLLTMLAVTWRYRSEHRSVAQ